jgi:hypothetical protein
MLEIIRDVTVIIVAIAMALPFAHALEWPGKLRLSKEHYLATQPIYYPGFTYAGFVEPLGLLLLLILLLLTPAGTEEFWLALAALLALLTMHATYWFLTHPLNNFWLEGFKLKGFGRKFFAFGRSRQSDDAKPDWTEMRDRWELSHMIRAAFGLIALVLLVAAS